MELETSSYSASGPSLDDCYFLAQRYEAGAGYHPSEAECWSLGIVANGKGGYLISRYRGTTTWFTGLWYAPSGRVYICDTDGRIFANSELRANYGKGKWQETTLGGSLLGIWGLDDDCIITWGSRAEEHPVFRYDGKSWTEIANPGFEIDSIHGLSPDLVYAVGHEGGIARFDGKAWQRLPALNDEELTSVFLADPDEIYAVGARGSVLQGSSRDWDKIGEGPGFPGPLACVAKFKGELWIGAGRFGLAKRQGSTSVMELVKPNIKAVSLDVRRDMVIASRDAIIGTSDGAEFWGTAKGFLLEDLAAKPLCFFA